MKIPLTRNHNNTMVKLTLNSIEMADLTWCLRYFRPTRFSMYNPQDTKETEPFFFLHQADPYYRVLQRKGHIISPSTSLSGMVFFHFRKVADGAIVEEYGVLNWLKLRYVGSFVWPPWLFLKISTCFPLQMWKWKF
jgi:hypothetical protein